MRNVLYLLILSMFLLAACGGGGDDGDDNNNGGDAGDTTSDISTDDLIATTEAELVEEADDPPPDDDVVDPEPTTEPRITTDPNAVTTFSTPDPNDPGEDFVAPPIGVLGEASTEDPQPGEPLTEEDLRTDFDYIYYSQTLLVDASTGETSTLELEVYSDGRVVVDRDPENTFNVTQAQLTAIADIINEVDFFYMQNTFLGGVPQSEGSYRYFMAVVRGDLERNINAEDGFMPPEIRRLFSAVRGLAEQVPNLFPEAQVTGLPTEDGS